MRPVLLALAVTAALPVATRAADLRNFEDAALRAVQFVDQKEGWAVGDEGVVWHTIDGGKNWERQPTGTRASLRSVQFLTPYTGWVAGREELPYGSGSAGVLLVTRDGGWKWERVVGSQLPGLNQVRFFDDKAGFVVGDGTDQYPTGIFATVDGGKSWKAIPGPRCPAWLAASFQDIQTGVLAGAWNRLAILRRGKLTAADVDTLGGRTVRGLQVNGNWAIAVGDGGLVLVSRDSAGAQWGPATLANGQGTLPTDVLSCLDFHAVHCINDQIWIVGRPGSVVLHSPDHGKSWELRSTGQSVPLHGVQFIDSQRGWAVGELGTILGTTDGGKTWTPQRRGGQRAAVLLVHARADAVPLDTVACMGGEEGYLMTAVRVIGADPASARASQATEPDRLGAALRRAGGAAGESLWQFPVAQHLGKADKADLIAAWDRLHAERAAEELLRQLVLALRIWQPDVVVTDYPDSQVTGWPADALVAEAVHEAFTRAGDAKAFPEQIERLGLKPRQPAKLYGIWNKPGGAQIVIDLDRVRGALASTARDFAQDAAATFADTPVRFPAQRYYRLLDSRMAGAASHRDLLQGVALAPGGTARRRLPPGDDPSPELEKTIRARRNLQVLAETPPSELTSPEKLLAQIGPTLAGLSADQGAPAALAVANQYVRLGQWPLAREAFLLMVDRYPAHPLSAEAYRWLIRLNSSSEARRRQELGQFLLVTQSETRQSQAPYPGSEGTIRGGPEQVQTRQLTLLGSLEESRKWYEGSLKIEPRLAAFGALCGNDPSVQFPLQAARRSLGDFETARKWYTRFLSDHPDGPWHDAAAAELWLISRFGPPPKPLALCRQTDTRPFLDGNLDDACWQGLKPLRFANAGGDTAKDYPTEAWLAYDKDFLYLALRCQHPSERYVPPAKTRPRDADLRPYDRVSLLLDLDRDYSTCFHLQVDQRGCVSDDCWGDKSWNPRWFVALKSEPTYWQIEAAIPMMQLTGDPVTLGRTWAFNVVRTLPGRGVQAFSLPADVQPRPEGMGLLLFMKEKEGIQQAVKPQPATPRGN